MHDIRGSKDTKYLLKTRKISNIFIKNQKKAARLSGDWGVKKRTRHPALDAGSPKKQILIIRRLRVKPAMTGGNQVLFITQQTSSLLTGSPAKVVGLGINLS